MTSTISDSQAHLAVPDTKECAADGISRAEQVVAAESTDRGDVSLSALLQEAGEADAVPRPPAWNGLFGCCRSALPLVVTDIVVGAVCLVGTSTFCHWTLGASPASSHLLLMLAALLVSLAFAGIYPGIGVNPVVEMRRFSMGTTAFMVTLLVACHVAATPAVERLVFITVSYLALLASLPLSRYLTRRRLRACSWWGEPALILGGGNGGRRIYDKLERQPERGLRPFGILAESRSHDRDRRNYIPFVSAKEITRLVRKERITWAIVANTCSESELQAWQIVAKDIPHLIIESEQGVPCLWTQTGECGSHAALHVRNSLTMPWPCCIKRFIDLLVTLSLSILLAPLFICVAVMIKLVSPGPIFFGHRRFGRDKTTFKAWKFRTMVTDADVVLKELLASDPAALREWQEDQKLRNDPRIIPVVGELLRKWSLDELPQLWNVLLGEMSLVGPRPIVSDEVAKYGDDFLLYKQVRPGITGLWQVSGRNNTGYVERVSLDCYYVNNWSPWLDAYILVRTIPTVVFREGAY